MKAKKSWREKVNNHRAPEITEGPEIWAKKFDGNKMLISSPAVIESKVKEIPKGMILTTPELREMMAKEHGANFSCPMTTGIFLRMVAEANEEDLQKDSHTEMAPYWRVVGEKGELNPKFPGGMEAQAEKLEAEGHEVIRKSPTKYLVRLVK